MSLLAGTPGDYIEEAAIERRRQIERERLMRIKDPRQWKVGVDTDALAAQIAAKQKAAALEKQRDLAYDNERLLMDQQIAYLEQERQRVEREKLKALDAQRDATQKRTMAREYESWSAPRSRLHMHHGFPGEQHRPERRRGMLVLSAAFAVLSSRRKSESA